MGRTVCIRAFCVAWLLLAAMGSAVAAVPGDLTGDGQTDVSDVQCAVLAVLADQAPPCMVSGSAADLDCSGEADISDVQIAVQIALTWPFPGINVEADIDGDNVHDQCDNCVGAFNPGQEDVDSDGIGDACAGGGICGNGILEMGEECDDGNSQDHDGCNFKCQVEQFEPQCGNGIVEGTELCDDGNLEDGDGCSAECLYENFTALMCGNLVVEPENDEECDDGNTVDGDGCNQWCKKEGPCGNGNLEVGEECDDGNNIDFDGCSAQCMTEANLGGIAGLVFYMGALTPNYKIQLKAFDQPIEDPSFPEIDPIAVVQYYEVKFPAFYLLELPPGEYWITATLCLEVQMPTGEGDGIGIEYPTTVIIKDGELQVGVNFIIPTLEGQTGTISGQLNWDGPIFDTHFIGVLVTPTLPPDMQIMGEYQVPPPVTFPHQYSIDNITPGDYYIVSYYQDFEISEGQPGGTYGMGIYPDLLSPMQVTVKGGEEVEGVDIWLQEKE